MRRLLVSAAVAFLALTGTASATYPGRNGEIAYGGRGNDGFFLALLSPSTRHERRLLSCDTCDGQGENFSASGRHLLFQAGDTIHEIAVDGTGARVLPGQAPSAPNADPAYSPHGVDVAVTGHADRGPHSDIYVVRPGTGAERRLTFRGGRWPAWSSTNRIAFTRGARCPQLQIAGWSPWCTGGALYTIRPDGSGLRRLTHDDAEAPDWSPRGRSLAFLRRGDIYTIRADGTHLRRVVPGQTIQSVVWSPDGRRLLFWSDFSIHSVSATGGPSTTVVGAEPADPEQNDAGSSTSNHPAWRPIP